MRPVNLMLILSFLVYLDLRILTPLLPSISASFGSSAGAVGLAMTSYTLAYAFGQFFYGPLSDRMGRIAVIRVVTIGFCLLALLSALATQTWQFVVLRLIAGAFAGSVIPLTMLFIADSVAYERRQPVFGYMLAISSVSMILAASIGGMVAHHLSWRAMFLGYGLLAIIPLILLWRVKVDRPQATSGGTEPFRNFLRNPRALFIYTAVFIEGALLWGGMTYIGSFAVKRYGLDQFAVGLMISIFGVGMLVSGLAIGWIRRYLSEKAQATAGGFLMGGSFLVLIPSFPLWVFVPAIFALGLGIVILHSILQIRGTEISLTARGKAFSLFVVGNLSGVAFGSAVFAQIVNAGLYETMLLISGLGLIATGLATAFAPRISHRS